MNFEECKIVTEKTARISTFGNLKTASKVWFVLHGYGQLSTYFIRKFSTLDPTDNFIIAPEGLNRFYLKNSSGRVGASWMTKEARLDDIKDYIQYLDTVYRHYLTDFKTSKKIIVLGFSQGAATACRWLCAANSKAGRLVLWAGVFPPDLEMNLALPVVNSLKTIYCLGDSDIYFPEEKQQELFLYLQENHIKFDLFPYSGGHTIPRDALVNLEKLLNRE